MTLPMIVFILPPLRTTDITDYILMISNGRIPTVRVWECS